MSDLRINLTEREQPAAKWQQSGEKFPNGNTCDTIGGINGTYPLQGMQPADPLFLWHRGVHAVDGMTPLPPRVVAALNQLGLIVTGMVGRPLSDSANALRALAALVEE
jgi:hypothetical protein